MVFLFSRIHSDIINTQLRVFGFPLECVFWGRREHGHASLSASKSLARPSMEQGSGPPGHGAHWTQVGAPSAPPVRLRVPSAPAVVLPAALSLPPSQALDHNKGRKPHKHRRTDLHGQTCSQLVTTECSRVWVSAGWLLAGTPAQGGELCCHGSLAGGVEKGQGQRV